LIQVAVLEQAGHQCRFVEGAARNMTEEQVLGEVKSFGPNLVIVHTTTPSIENDIEYARKAKELSGGMTILVGAHASAVAEETLRMGVGAVDMVARGEVDFTLRDVANGVAWDQIAGLSYWKDGQCLHNTAREFLDVNDLPFPAWQHIDPHWYNDAGKLHPFLTLYTGRGCFAHCTFCRETQVVNGRRLRMRSASKVVDEMQHDLELFPYLREIMFETDTFTAVPSHVREVCDEIMRRGLHEKVRWSCNVRVDVKHDLLPLMKQAGCRMLMVGFEFGTNPQLESVKKGTTVEMGRAFAEAAHRLGFVIHGCFMIGAPGETPESARATIDFAKSLPLDTMQVSGIVVYPGTEMYAWAERSGFICAREWRDWVDADHEQVTLLSYPQMTKKQIDAYIDKALKEFYLRPTQMLKMALAMRSWDDVRRKFYGLKSFLNYFSGAKRNAKSCVSAMPVARRTRAAVSTKVAVVVAVHNEEKYLADLLDGLLSQTHPADEIIVVDDGSSDSTPKLLCRYAQAHPQIKYVSQVKSGPAASRNKAWRISTADICVFTDGDCVPRADWLEKLLGPFEDNTVGAAGGTYDTINVESRLARFIGLEIAWRYRNVPPYDAVDVHGSYNLAVRKKVLEEVGGFNEEYKKPSGEDWDMTFKISRRHRIVFVPEAVVGHHHPDRVVSYLHNQTQRALDRVRLYRDHPDKRGSDSYTGKLAKYQVLSAPALLAALAGWAILGVTVWILLAALLGTLALSIDLLLYVGKRDFGALVVGVPTVFCRNFAWFFGLVRGILMRGR
jgi:radical SAM superfamily enzyme YgiQ (UPF0313 family)/glycosyltransferase involved in cell wall biosynthesis